MSFYSIARRVLAVLEEPDEPPEARLIEKEIRLLRKLLPWRGFWQEPTPELNETYFAWRQRALQMTLSQKEDDGQSSASV